MGSQLYLQLEFGPQDTKYRPLDQLKEAKSRESMRDLLENRLLGRAEDLRRLITFEKLKGTLDEVIYSMEAAQIDFMPYQFKPVLKFNQSRTQRLLLADEVGLGKTIESGLIWLEMQARSDAKRLLVVCKKTLCFNWAEELRTKFGIDAIEANFKDVGQALHKLEAEGPNHSFALIVSYDTLRGSRNEWDYINSGDDSELDAPVSPKGRLLRKIKEWHEHFKAPPFDLTIFDEAALMKNPAAMRTRTGAILADASNGTLVVTATPLMVGQKDLQTLLKLVDNDFFENEFLFTTLLQENRPAVSLANALASIPVQLELARKELETLKGSEFVGSSPLIPKLFDEINAIENSKGKDRIQHTVRAQGLAENLNILASFMTRTRRVQVQELRTERVPVILPVTMTKQEKQFYWSVIEHVRQEAEKDDRPFHVFQQIGLQLRSASCIPALVHEMRSQRIIQDDSLFEEVLDSECGNPINDDEQIFTATKFKELLKHDFEQNDTKFAALEAFIDGLNKGEKVVLFAYYRGTLSYLYRRLNNKGIRCAMIHGGLTSEQRKDEIERFRDAPNVPFLLSSEVGSEGLNLQFSRILLNYDLPWNPMKVEQRIGRIDRIGQAAEKISIIHFKVKDTIEDRLYSRLHERLELFKNSVGDLADVLGNEIQKLSSELISKPLTEDEINAKIEQAGIATQTKLQQIKQLESEGEGLLAFSDYLQTKIRDDIEQERYVTPSELEDYVSDFFQNHFIGTEIQHASPEVNCFTIRLSQQARQALDDFIGNDTTQRARAVRGDNFSITFRREVIQGLHKQAKSKVAFLNHLSPLIQWITEERTRGNEEFIPSSATQLVNDHFSPGTWIFRIEHWQFNGIQNSSRLAYAAARLGDDRALIGADAETLARMAIRKGTTWTDPKFDTDEALTYADILESLTDNDRDQAYDDFKAKNETTANIRKARIQAQRDRMVTSIQDTLAVLIEKNRKDSIIKATQGRLKNTRKRFDDKLATLEDISDSDASFNDVALGICHITRS